MEKQKKIAIIGLGYVGLPLAIAFSEFYQVCGFDVNSTRICDLKNSIDSNGDIIVSINDKLEFTSDEKILASSNIFIVTVPTPVNHNNVPDLSILKNATRMIAKYISKGDIVIYESTVYPGVTEEICVPILEEDSGLKYNFDFYCGYSPERISPGAEKYSLENIVKVTSGSTLEVADNIDRMYQKIIKAGTYKAPSIKIAEAAKVVENTQRDVNIALMNELSMMFDKMNIDTSEVLEAAKTKWNFLDFKPGLVGGHCLPVDPFYLYHLSKLKGHNANFMLAGRNVNDQLQKFLEKIILKKIVKEKSKKILICGITYKANVPDLRNSLAFNIYFNLKKKKNLLVNAYDPIVDKLSQKKYNIKKSIKNLAYYDLIIVLVKHKNYLKILENHKKKSLNKYLDIFRYIA